MTDPVPRQRRGCLRYGCLAVVVLVVLFLIAVLVGLRYFKNLLLQFTDAQPVPVPVLQVSPAQSAELASRLDQFQRALQAGHSIEPLALTPQDINAFIASDPRLEGARGKVFVVIQGNELKGQLCLPLEGTRQSFLQGRYLNGVATFQLALRNGQLELFVRSLRLHDRQPPASLLNRVFQNLNLAAAANADSNTAAVLSQLVDLQVKDGQLILVPRPPGSPPQ